MIQINLLPDIKIQFCVCTACATSSISVALLVLVVCGSLMSYLIYTTRFVQTKTIANSQKNIQNLTQNLTKASDGSDNRAEINKVLTLQNQMRSLEFLEYQKRETTDRLVHAIKGLVAKPENYTGPEDYTGIHHIAIDFQTREFVLQARVKSPEPKNPTAKRPTAVEYTYSVVDNIQDATYTIKDREGQILKEGSVFTKPIKYNFLNQTDSAVIDLYVSGTIDSALFNDYLMVDDSSEGSYRKLETTISPSAWVRASVPVVPVTTSPSLIGSKV